MAVGDVVGAWRPRTAGVAEVLHAAWRDHAYPAHTHNTWTLLLVDDGRIGYELNRHGHAAVTSGVTLLPPHVVHDGRPATASGFRKRVVYLDESQLAEDPRRGPTVARRLNAWKTTRSPRRSRPRSRSSCATTSNRGSA